MKWKFLLAALFVPGLCLGAIWPETLGPWHRAASLRAVLADRPIWDEYGLKESEAARYENGDAQFTATAYRLQDTTGALAAFDWQRPAQSTPATLAAMTAPAALAAETADSLLVVRGNYLFAFGGRKPEAADLTILFDGLRNMDTTTLPSLPGFLPTQDRVPNSERYITGPVALQKFAPGIPPSVAAFHFSAEGQLTVFHGPKGDLKLVVFSYPTHQMAMQQEPLFRSLPGGIIVKRSGPLVAAVLEPTDPDAAERLLSGVRYQAVVTLDERVSTQRDNIGNLVINAFVLIGILLGFAVISGLAVGGVKAFRHRGKRGEEADALTTLNL
jgi:hypothetical protein